jgi:hypothetical protein
MENLKVMVQKEFLTKVEMLENAKAVLKTEFFGLDDIIDQLVDNSSSWFTLYEIQEKPAVINLWGLTGVGKSSLIKRFVELISYQNKFYRFDLGEKSGFNSFSRAISDMCENDDESPVIIMLDEFQHAKSLTKPFGKEVDEEKNRTIWELIDSGKINFINYSKGIWRIEDELIMYIGLLQNGVIVEDGKIVSGKELYMRETKEEQAEIFFSDSFISSVIYILGKELSFNLKKDFNDYIAKLNNNDLVSFLFKIIEIAKSPSEKNFSKALIFVVGNLDEAYPMTGDLNIDISADEFNKMSKEINVLHIKNALKQRFREEQIARLGNTHIIYPALDSMSYKKIIKNEFSKIVSNIKNITNITLEIDESIMALVYTEGVFPTQGVRPIFTSIHSIVKSNLSHILSKAYTFGFDISQVHLSFSDGILESKYYDSNKTLVGDLNMVLKLSLDKIRENRKDEMQAITAVHESGHAILMYLLEGKIPDAIYSVSAELGTSGFVFINEKNKFMSRKSLLSKTAMLLGGIVAEQIIFGEENITMGSSSDLKKLTANIMLAFKRSGIGGNYISCAFSHDQDDLVYHNINSVEEDVLAFINQAKKLAIDTLEREKTLLIEMSEYLSVNTNMNKQQTIKFFDKHCRTKPNGVNKHFYRNKLSNAKSLTSDMTSITNSPIILNREEE